MRMTWRRYHQYYNWAIRWPISGIVRGSYEPSLTRKRTRPDCALPIHTESRIAARRALCGNDLMFSRHALW